MTNRKRREMLRFVRTIRPIFFPPDETKKMLGLSPEDDLPPMPYYRWGRRVRYFLGDIELIRKLNPVRPPPDGMWVLPRAWDFDEVANYIPRLRFYPLGLVSVLLNVDLGWLLRLCRAGRIQHYVCKYRMGKKKKEHIVLRRQHLDKLIYQGPLPKTTQQKGESVPCAPNLDSLGQETEVLHPQTDPEE